MPPVGFEPTISAGERPKTYALDRAATEAGAGLSSRPNLCTHPKHMGPYRFSRNHDRTAGLILPILNISVDCFMTSISRPTVAPHNVHADT